MPEDRRAMPVGASHHAAQSAQHQSQPIPRRDHPDSPASESAQSAPKPRVIEVNLVRRYCPHWLISADGAMVANVGDALEILNPAVVELHPDDAEIALASGAALPTKKTFKM